MKETPPPFESSHEKILTREEVLTKIIEYAVAFAGTTPYEIIGDGVDPLGLTLLEVEIKDPNSDGFVVFSYARKKETNQYGRGSLETVIHYYTRDANHIEDGGGSSVAKYTDGAWKATKEASWLQ